MSARTMDRLERVCLRKNEMSERRWQRRRAKWQRASLGNQEESDGGEGTAAGTGVGAGGAPHAEGGRRKRREHQDLRHEGVAASAVLCEVGLMSGAAPVMELKGRQTDTSLGWTTRDLDEDPRCLD